MEIDNKISLIFSRLLLYLVIIPIFLLIEMLILAAPIKKELYGELVYRVWFNIGMVIVFLILYIPASILTFISIRKNDVRSLRIGFVLGFSSWFPGFFAISNIITSFIRRSDQIIWGLFGISILHPSLEINPLNLLIILEINVPKIPILLLILLGLNIGVFFIYLAFSAHLKSFFNKSLWIY